MRTLLSVLLLAAALVPATAVSAQAGAPDDSSPVTVMTRNVYLGADINRPVNAALAAQAAGGGPEQVLGALAQATHVTREIVDLTDFTVRSDLLAEEIAETEPDLVGLQEVALWRSGPFDPFGIANPSAQTVDYDFLEILLDDLEDEGVEYAAVDVARRADVEAPSFETHPGDGTARNVRMTMRDVILMREDAGLRVPRSGGDVYETNLEVEIAGVALNFDRGYNWVDVRRAGATGMAARPFRFVNTHLEAFSSDIAYAQAAELLDEAAVRGRTTVLVCDCNSDPLDDSVKPIDTVPHKAPYELIVSSGFTDMWLDWAAAEEGWTAGLSETVDDPDGSGFDHRIDMIFVRPGGGAGLPDVTDGEVTGDEPTDRAPVTGLWPSDHAGVVLTLEGLR